jgi:subtilisin family serine protease
MATPQVAGVAALMRSVNPSLPNTRVVELIKATASQCGTYGNGLGWGIIRADEAVLAAVGARVIGLPSEGALGFRPRLYPPRRSSPARRG